MSTLYLGTDVEQLAHHLAAHLDQSARSGDFFAPATLVVPHRAMGQWLKFWLARQQGVAINLRFLFLEASLWEMLQEIDPRPQDPAPELLDGDSYRLLVLTVLQLQAALDKLAGAESEYWRHHLLRAGAAGSRQYSRRLWQLADQLGTLIRDYEYHRQDALIQHWLKGEFGLDASHRDLELAQQTIFRDITRIPDGLRAKLNEAWQRNFKTLPQYAMEVMEHFTLAKLRPAAGPRRTVHLFGLTQISSLHARTLHWLGRFFDLHVYHYTALAGRLGPRPTRSAMIQLAQHVRDPATGRPEAPVLPPGEELLLAWGRAGAESLETMAELAAEPRGLSIELVESRKASLPLFAGGETVLRRLQAHLAGSGTDSVKLPQDRSMQIAGCPGMVREVETVYHSILANLQQQPDLKQSDIAVLATDMDLYRPVLQAVFERRDRRVHYNLSDFSAAGISIFGQALVGMLDLALDSFTRSKVFAVLLNPCFLARLGVDRNQALVWLDWVQALGVYQSWDQSDKKERGYGDSPQFAWQLGLRRLRLGRIMEVGRDDQIQNVPRFGQVIPYADLHSCDPEELNAFCLAVDGMLPRLARLRNFQGNAGQWVHELDALMRDFLEIGPDRPEETPVRARLLAAMQKWLLLDCRVQSAECRSADGNEFNLQSPIGNLQSPLLSLALVREMVISSLEGIEGERGQFSTGGVTIAALHPLKQIPFRIVYILGLGEDIFPGSNVLSGLDLRGLKWVPGDIRPAESNRHLFMETLLAVRDKVYLLYNNLDIQKDQILHPAAPLQQLKRYLADRILDREFVEAKVPLLANDESYLQAGNMPKGPSDLLVQFDESDRLLAALSARRGGLVLTPPQENELQNRLRRHQADFSIDDPNSSASEESHLAGARVLTATVSLRDLGKYLEFPVPAALKYHLRLLDTETEELAEDEPFVSDRTTANRLIRQMLEFMVSSAVQSGVDAALAQWRSRFAGLYQEWALRGLVPEEAFGQVDLAVLERDLEQRIGHLEHFVRERKDVAFCGPMLLGESPMPIGAREHFPALELPLRSRIRENAAAHEPKVRLVGSIAQAWRSDASLEVLVWCFQDLGTENDRKKNVLRYLFEPVLFFMALRTAAPSDGRDWLGGREFKIHVAHAGGIEMCGYPPEHVSPETARKYLTELVMDFLDPHCLDLLPLRKIVAKWDLKTICGPDTGLSRDFADLLDDYLAEDAESGSRWNQWSTPLVALVDAKVPTDAFAKLRRRVWPFYFADPA